jgi:hypothetical protein
MRLAGVKENDVIHVDIGGRKFMALAGKKTARGLKFTPLDPRISYHEAKTREVIGHWSRRANSEVPFVNRLVAAA